MEIPNNKLLLMNIDELDLTDNCKKYLLVQGINSLPDFIKTGWAGQKRKTAFDILHFNEVVRLLERNKLLYLMEGK